MDISDDVYAQLKVKAASERTSVKALISSAVQLLLTTENTARKHRRVDLPLIGKNAPGTLKITNELIYEHLDL